MKESSRVDIATFILALICAIGGAYKFSSLDAKLGEVDLDIKRDTLRTMREQLLVVSGKISSSNNLREYYNPLRVSRRVTLAFTLKNDGSTDLRIKDIELSSFKQTLDPSWTAPKSEEAAPVMPDAPAPPAPSAARRLNPLQLAGLRRPVKAAEDINESAKIEMIDIHSPGDPGWERIGEPWVYDVRKINDHEQAGVIRRGQTRSIQVEFLVEDSDTPELIKFRAVVTSIDNERGELKSFWTGVIGCGPLAKFFEPERTMYNESSPAAPSAPEAPVPEPAPAA